MSVKGDHWLSHYVAYRTIGQCEKASSWTNANQWTDLTLSGDVRFTIYHQHDWGWVLMHVSEQVTPSKLAMAVLEGRRAAKKQ